MNKLDQAISNYMAELQAATEEYDVVNNRRTSNANSQTNLQAQIDADDAILAGLAQRVLDARTKLKGAL